MCIGMANGGKEPKCISGKISTYNGSIHIPSIMRDMLNIQHADTLQLTATGNIIVIEKCEGDENA